MAWCLFEALRDDECKFLATEDSRAGGLLTKWVACGGSDRRGLALQLATREGFQAFATCRRGGKYLNHARVMPKLDRRLWAHMTAITEVFVADGAADEQMASELRPRALAHVGGDACASVVGN